MGSHKKWRRIAKRERRRIIRTKLAKKRDNVLYQSSNAYNSWLKEQEALELFEMEQIEKQNEEENEKWVKAENIAIEQWQKLQERNAKLQQQLHEKQAKLRLEWELEQEKKKKEEERLREIEQENIRQQQNFMNKLEQFLSGDSIDPPPELTVSRESRPEAAPCPFFSKTACCRFGDQCSRNHKYPGISKVILATNFFSHFGLENATFSEYDTDVMLEYEDSDTYKEFKDFFYDVLPEFEKFGRIVQFKVCNNYEKHLRGNTYVEFTKLRCAVAAYRSLHTRWYGGKQISLQFCNISSWRNAICGLQSTQRCPKGRACNYLHVFKNPNDLFGLYSFYNNSSNEDKRSRRTPPRSWRWSESPEVEIPKKRRSESRDDKRNTSRDLKKPSSKEHKRHNESHQNRDRRKRTSRRSRRSP